MELSVRIKMNDKLFLRDPEESVLGRKILSHGLALINKLGFEQFTFKKLAEEIETTEAGVYRYFENKHRLLVYYVNWYWSYTEYKLSFLLNNIEDPETKIKLIIQTLVVPPNGKAMVTEGISEVQAYQLVRLEGSKSYLTRNVADYNKSKLFKPYKDLCIAVAETMLEYNPKYKYSHSLASTLLEMSHAQMFFMENLPALSDSRKADPQKLIAFLEHLVFCALD
jgi:AcrR family transcriptional regulator